MKRLLTAAVGTWLGWLMLASCAAAQHALPLASLASGSLSVVSVEAPDEATLPVRVVLGEAGAARFRVDVWVTASAADAHALLEARLATLSTTGLVARTDLASAWGSSASGASTLVAAAASNVVFVVRAIDQSDAVPVATRLAAAVLASDAGVTSVVRAPRTLDPATTVQTPPHAAAFLVTCESGCSARRVPSGFRVERSGGEASLTMHVVDDQLRVSHVHATYP
jgi:hypothetical protein